MNIAVKSLVASSVADLTDFCREVRRKAATYPNSHNTPSPTYMQSLTHWHSLTSIHSLTHTRSLTYSFTGTLSLTHLRHVTHSPHSLNTHSRHSLTHSFTHSLITPLPHSTHFERAFNSESMEHRLVSDFKMLRPLHSHSSPMVIPGLFCSILTLSNLRTTYSLVFISMPMTNT